MRSLSRRVVGTTAVATVAALFGVGAAQVGCGTAQNGASEGPATSAAGQPGNEATGTVNFALTLPGGQQISTVTYSLTNGGVPVVLPVPNPGTVQVSNSASISFQLGGVPAATGDAIAISANTTGGGICQGSASGINIAAGATTTVTVQILCSLPGADAGNLFVSATPSYCGSWTSLSTNGSEAYVGESVVLSATAVGPAPNSLGYTWTMSNPIGVFGAIQPDGGVGSTGQDEAVGPTDPMQFMCTSPGTTTVTLVVDDGPVPAGAGACPTNLSTTTTTITCDPWPASQVESAWVELAGPNGGSNGFTGNVAIARAVTAYVPPADAGTTNPCPAITINGGAPVQMNLRAAATTSIPARSVNTAPNKPSLFPVSSCEYVLPANVTSAVVAGRSLPLPKANPTKIVVIGDTGCRLQNGNGTQSCNDTNPAGTDTPYPFAAIAAAAAAQNPDLVLHVGDWDYRDNECPAGLGYNRGGSPWGFGWDTWEADVFTPGAALLAAAPWIMTRGNHEQCNRAGQGWYRFLDTSPWDTTGHHTCDNAADDQTATGGSYNNPFLVQINAAAQILVFDTSNAKPISGTPTGTTSTFYTTYQQELTIAGSLVGAAPLPFNLWSNHHPIFGYATATAPALPTNPIPLFTPIMNSVYPGTYYPPQINLAMHGHTHDYQALDFATGTLPDAGTFQPAATLVSGNAGDILDTSLPYPLTGTAVSAVGNPTAVSVATVGGVQQFATSDNGAPFQNPNSSTDNSYGYMVLQFNAGSSPTWTATEYRWDNTVRDVCTIQTTGSMSCASWGVIQPDSNGAY